MTGKPRLEPNFSLFPRSNNLNCYNICMWKKNTFCNAICRYDSLPYFTRVIIALRYSCIRTTIINTSKIIRFFDIIVFDVNIWLPIISSLFPRNPSESSFSSYSYKVFIWLTICWFYQDKTNVLQIKVDFK